MAFETTSRPMSVVQSTSIAALRPDCIGHCTRKGPRWSCEDSGECRILAAQMCQQCRSFGSESDCFQQDTTAADFDCAFAFPEAWSSKICAWSNSAVGAISGLMVWPSCFTRPWSNRYENANIWGRTNRLLFCEVQNWRNMFLIWALFLLRYVSTTETTLYQRTFWSFLPTILFASSVWSHHAASWRIRVQASEGWNQASVAMCRWQICQLASPCDTDKIKGCQFPCWNCSGPLSFGLVHWFCPSNTNLPLLHGCASGSNFSGWKRTCLGLHMLKVWQ